VLAAALAMSACGGDGGSNARSPRAATQAALASAPCGTYSGRGCAPDDRRVDLRQPSFSHSTEITNPLFPISRLESVVLLGHVGGKTFRTETTLLAGTRTVAWNGEQVRVLVSQYVAYLDGRLEEVALDRYGQADDGSVWYFGEDVFEYRNGVVATTDGTWLAGRDGPPAMIMPAKPNVGDVYRTENAAGIVFEEVTVKAIGTTVTGPLGPVDGAMVAEELHNDQTHEDKTFAPGYGEFRTAGGGDLEALALAVPTDASPAPAPPELGLLATSAEATLESARIREWDAASATLRRMDAAWGKLRAGRQPRMIAARLGDGLNALGRALGTRRSGAVTQRAVDVEQSVLDLQLRYRPPVDVDVDRFHLWTQQLRVHAAAKDLAGVTGDVAVLEWIRDRIADALGPAARQEVDNRLRALRAAADGRNLPAAADHAARLGARVRNLAGGRSSA
jgi:hypothetical protein